METPTIQNLIAHSRIDCEDIQLEQAQMMGYDTVQPKYDGWWVLVYLSAESALVYSTSGRLLDMIKTPDAPDTRNCILIGEFMYGTNWAQSNSPGTIYVHDCIAGIEPDMISRCYEDRYLEASCIVTLLNNPRFKMIPSFPIKVADFMWSSFVDQDGFEGLVYKDSRSMLEPGSVKFGRTKKDFTMDYIVVGYIEGQGKHTNSLGSIEAGLIIDGMVQKVTAIGGGYSDNQRAVIWNDRELYLGRVFEAKGKQVFPSGALRHGNFIRFRDDKAPERCTWNKNTGGK